MSKVVKGAKKLIKKGGEMIAAPFEAAWHTGEAFIDLVGGDTSGFTENISKAAGDSVKSMTGSNRLKNLASAGTAYGLLNFNQGSEFLEKATGWDIDNSNAEAAERAAQEEYQRQVDEANAAAQRNRRANLLATRKSLTPTLSKSSQGGATAGTNNNVNGMGGIILG